MQSIRACPLGFFKQYFIGADEWTWARHCSDYIASSHQQEESPSSMIKRTESLGQFIRGTYRKVLTIVNMADACNMTESVGTNTLDHLASSHLYVTFTHA